LDTPVATKKRRPELIDRVLFDLGDRGRLFVGTTPLEKYLRDGGLKWVLRLAALLEELDWKAFEASYQSGGRPGLHPKRVVGLILYGLMLQQKSLRQLEALALRDVGAWWITGGLTPDFTTITKFMQRHEKVLTEDFFVAMTSLIVKRLKLTHSDVAIDGTVVQAAASTATAMKREALEKKLDAAKDAGDVPLTKKLEQAVEVLEQRQEHREAAGREGEAQVSPEDPEAVLQPMKNSDDYKLGVKPVIAAHPSGLIVSQTVAPHSETGAVPELLVQHERVFGAQPQRALADAGFSSIVMLRLFLEKNIDALIPSGRGTGERLGRNGLFPRTAFNWDEDAQRPLCPAGRPMSGGGALLTDRGGRRYREYQGKDCGQCPLRAQCTKSQKKPRKLKRYEGDELRDAMSVVMAHPQAKREYRRRAAIVEPVFARMKNAGLSRFSRRGLRGARLEFALACVSHNLRLVLWRGRGCLLAFAITSRHGEPWRLIIIGAAFDQPDPSRR
jgi:transposase